MSNRIESAIIRMRERLATKSIEDVERADKAMAITFAEHFAFQTQQSRAFASGKLTMDEAQIIYMALGESMSTKNGGWKPHVDTASKVVITQVIGELAGQFVGELRS